MPWTPPVHWTPQELRHWRAAHNLTQTEAAGFLNVLQVTYSNWELGRYPRDLDERMAQAEHARLHALDPRILPGESLDQFRKRLTKERAREAKGQEREAKRL